jgi:hypothetical protein
VAQEWKPLVQPLSLPSLCLSLSLSLPELPFDEPVMKLVRVSSITEAGPQCEAARSPTISLSLFSLSLSVSLSVITHSLVV